jgi:hypothetical protein
MIENFSSFQTDDSNKKYFLTQKWSKNLNESTNVYLRLVLSDCSNYWTGNCNYIICVIFKVSKLNAYIWI